jgi:hypothetical protein
MWIRIRAAIIKDEPLAAQYLAALLRGRRRDRVSQQSSRAQKFSLWVPAVFVLAHGLGRATV